jgi:hypothetical protein
VGGAGEGEGQRKKEGEEAAHRRRGSGFNFSEERARRWRSWTRGHWGIGGGLPCEGFQRGREGKEKSVQRRRHALKRCDREEMEEGRSGRGGNGHVARWEEDWSGHG